MTTTPQSWKTRARRVINSSDSDDFVQGYDDWAPEYDADHINFGTALLVQFVDLFCRHVAVDAGPILDAGAGTGRMAEALQLKGYRNFVGVDLSAGMLEVAARKGIYEELRQMRLGGPMDFSDGQFEVVASLGAISPNHIGADAFDELLRITKPGGLLVLSMRCGIKSMIGFDRKRSALVKAGHWRLINQVADFVSHPELDPPMRSSIYVYEALPR